MTTRIPLIAPRPARLSDHIGALRAVEDSGIYSNGGPVVRGFETDVVARMFGGVGESLAVANATLGLMIAIREAAGERARADGALAIVPALTFAATAHAAEWAGLTPLVCDIDPQEWSLSAAAEEALLRRHGKRVAVIVPYATFGAAIDLERYGWLSQKYGVGVVVDAAASLGTVDMAGRGFGTGSRFAIVFSMHATKAFATAEGGLIYSADTRRIAALRRMTNFGFGDARSAESAGLNAKLPEVLGLLAAAKLEGFESVSAHRADLYDAYQRGLADFSFQRVTARRQAAQFMPVLLPEVLAPARAEVVAGLAEGGIGAGTYFSPHLGEQPHFRTNALVEPTPVADAIGSRLLSLPLTEPMTTEDVAEVCVALREVCARVGLDRIVAPARPARREEVETLLVGGGPAGTAFLTAATKADRLTALAAGGLTIVERGHVLGSGELGKYAITSDSTAETFLTAVKDNVHPEIAALIDDASAQEVARYVGALGVPLTLAGPFLARVGAELGRLVVRGGGQLIDGSEVVEAQRTASGAWRTRVRDRANGIERIVTARNIVLATGGYQSADDVAAADVGGAALDELAGDRLVPSDTVLRLGGVEGLRTRLGDLRAPRIAIVGASTSALASAALLLKASPALPLGPGAITLVHRQPLRPFYPSAEAARADGFDDFGPDDICPLSGFVYRLGGFRLEARDLVLRLLEIGGRVREPRLALHQVQADDAAARAIIAEADVVIGALGYRPHGLTLRDTAGQRIALAADAAGRPRLVDQQCRVIDADGAVVPGAYGIGLAAGFVPWGRLGGEASFRGKANGLWLWQNDVGAMIVDQIVGARVQAAA